MIPKKLTYDSPICCPYCGGEMEYDYFGDCTTMLAYQCKECGSTAPYVLDGRGENKEPEAREKALRRAKPENRVLTLDELRSIKDSAIWIEHRYGYWSVAGWHILHGCSGSMMELDSQIVDTLNVGLTWRCWLRKPTDEERRNTPWEGRM